MLVRHGYQGFRFRDIADRLGTTRAAVHYHYGNKQKLCEAVVVQYITTLLGRWEHNWASEKIFSDKIIGMMEANRERYLVFNPTGRTTNPWSLISRMRVDRDLIGPKAQDAINGFGITLERLIIAAIGQAVMRGELVADIPRRDVALQLVAIADSAGAITQDGGGFERLDQLYRSFARIVEHAYGRARGDAAPPGIASIAGGRPGA
ncbi:TetR family transcriptional regulator [Aurantimonas aggregata]|uniref:TetR family transcriptional regulator n=1 Tax=Aurantimonas aggregata TaxID=2047720 RepID=A0A6L9MJY5_9HYPH|nr:TetR/AcrR family transcriptional regulator [Aurantimonas aggregata]NDV87908.1 TetR family transcriptional regulator [Aurantimonas aggregata]